MTAGQAGYGLSPVRPWRRESLRSGEGIRRARQADEAFAVVTASMGVSGDVEPAGEREAIGAVGDERGSVGEDSNDPPRRSGRARELQCDLAGPPRGTGGPIPARSEHWREFER